MSGSISTSAMDVYEMSYTTRGGTLRCHDQYSPLMSSCISNEDGIISILTTMTNFMIPKFHQNSSTCISASPLMSLVALIVIALSPHEEHNGMTIETLITACRETHAFNPLWLSLITMCMIPPQKQRPVKPNDITQCYCTCTAYSANVQCYMLCMYVRPL